MENVREKRRRRRKMTSGCALASRNFVYWVGEELGGVRTGGWERALMTTKRVTTTAHY
jgi:hypothetical protein